MAREDVTERIAEMDRAIADYKKARPQRGYQLIFSASCESRETLAQALEEAAERVRTLTHFQSCSSAGYWYELESHPWRRMCVEDKRYYLVDLMQEIF